MDWRQLCNTNVTRNVAELLDSQCVAVKFDIDKLFTLSAENTMPESSGTNTRDFVGFFLFWLISLPAIWFPLHKM